MDTKLMLYIGYDGGSFCGWQAQKNGLSVQAALTAAAEELFGRPCDVTGCSRTDAGVHARMFVVTVADKGAAGLSSAIPPERVPRALNVRLPDGISVRQALRVPGDLHPRYAVSSKEYVYRILHAPERDPFETGRAWHLPNTFTDTALDDMRATAAAMIGKRDFSSCMAAGSKIVDPVRHVLSASVTETPAHGGGTLCEFRVRADGFLYNMVRIMAGTLADVAVGHIDPASIPARLDACDRARMGRTAPACGLYLDRVFYDDPSVPGWHGSTSLPGMAGRAGPAPTESDECADGKEADDHGP